MSEIMDNSQITISQFISLVSLELDQESYQSISTDASTIINSLEAYASLINSNGSKLKWLLKKSFELSEQIQITCWKFTEKYFFEVSKKGCPPNIQVCIEDIDLPPFPTNFLARGLFTLDNKVVVRGYDKFFNIESSPTTRWDYLKENTSGPYEITVKENGCIIFVAYHPETDLLVTSKHYVSSINETMEEKDRHHQVGVRWLHHHLTQSNTSISDLKLFLKEFNVTLVFELCDDSFEEHIFSYEANGGLYLHGINYNDITLQTWPSSLVQKVAQHFGFHSVIFFTESGLDGVKALSEEAKGYLNNRPIEGFVVRCKDKNNATLFFKIKYDFPYLLFREWREVTKTLLSAHEKGKPFPVIKKTKFLLSTEYISWVKNKIKSEEKLFSNYLSNIGIVKIRELFLTETGHSPYDEPFDDPSSVPTTLVDSTPKILLVPIATPGSGKTVLLTTLLKLFDCGYVQSDDFKNKNRFYDEIVKNLESHNLVLVDRNNHLGILREELTSLVLSKYPETSIISVQWRLSESAEYSSIDLFEFTYKNILLRGVHHPSLTAFHTSNLEKTIMRFINTFEPLNSKKYPSDSNFSQNVVISLDKPLPGQIFERVLPALKSLPVPPKSYNFPSHTSIPKIESILSQSLDELTKTEYISKKVKLPTSLNRVSILLGSSLMKDLQKKLLSKEAFDFFPKAPLSNARAFIQQLRSKPSQGIVFSPGYYHVTLSHHEDPKIEFQNFYLNEVGSNWVGVGVQIYFDKLVWHQGKIMTLSVSSIHTIDASPYDPLKNSDSSIPIHTNITSCNISPCSKLSLCSNCMNSLPKGLYSSNKHLHVTVGVLSDSVSAKQSNDLLEALHTKNNFSENHKNSEWKPQFLRFNPPLVALGRVKLHGQTA